MLLIQDVMLLALLEVSATVNTVKPYNILHPSYT